MTCSFEEALERPLPRIGGEGDADLPGVSANCNIPSKVAAYSLNITAIPKTTLGYLRLWSSGKLQPLASAPNATTGTVVANAAILEAGTSGMFDVLPLTKRIW